ncbi:hypothetical protein SAMN04487885_11267 [Clostridium cadaveris]|uniref:UPF0246 protein SAMN04487885_11267 n=2 Tax=Clostridiaceae TaxID=31979 RepID=A0A1I2LZ48_9CLOT|nr:hypothetical protein SAMN04487885_11267 [Clostridium cadaveris]
MIMKEEEKGNTCMITIMSPTKTFNDNICPLKFDIEAMAFKDEIEELIAILKKYDVSEIMEIMKVSKVLGEATYKKYETFDDDIKGYEAIKYFYGEAFKGLDASTLDDEDIVFGHNHLVILSGLYGVVKPLDLIKPYRLEMGTKLKTANEKDLYGYWKDKLTTYMMKSIEDTSGEKVLLNLASDEYSKALDLKSIDEKYKVVTISFKENRDGKYKTIGTYAKKARGLMARYILKNKIDILEDIKYFNEDGYSFNEEQSDDNNFIFIR